MDDQTAKHLLEVAPGVAGSLVALPFLQGSWPERVAMAIGGALLSYYGTPMALAYLKVPNAAGLIGFLIGLFGMAIVAKIYEIVDSVSGRVLFSLMTDWLAGWLPKKKGE